MPDKLEDFYNAIKSNKSIEGLPSDYNQFKTAMQDEKVSKSFFDAIKPNKSIEGLPSDYETFSTALELKKKEQTIPTTSNGLGNSSTQELGSSGKTKTVEEFNAKYGTNYTDLKTGQTKVDNAEKGVLVPFSPIKVKQPSGEKDFIAPKTTLPDLTKAPMKRYEKAYEGITGRIDNNTKEFDKLTAEAEKSGKELKGTIDKYNGELQQASTVIQNELKAKYQGLIDNKSISAEEANLKLQEEYKKGFDVAQKEITGKYKPSLDAYTALTDKRKTLHNSIKSDIERAKLLSGSVGIIERNVNKQLSADQSSLENAVISGLTNTGTMLSGALPFFTRFTNNNLAEFALKSNMPDLAKVAFENQSEADKSVLLQKMESAAKEYAARGAYYSNKIAEKEGTLVDNFSNGNYVQAGKVAGIRFLESLPMMGVAVGMTALTGGVAQSIIPGGFLFGSQNYYGDYADRTDMSESDKLNASFAKGSLEMITELSVLPLLSPLKSIIKTGSKEVAKEAIEKTLFGAMKEGYSKALPYFGWVQEGASEYVNAVGSKIVDKIFDPKFEDKDWQQVLKEANIDGLEAFGPGAFGGATLTLPVAINSTINQYKSKVQAREFASELEKIEQDIANPNLTDAQKDILIARKQEIHGKLNEVFDADKEATAGATTEQISALDDINDQQDEVAVALQDETISEESKVAFEEKAKELAEQEKTVLEEIKANEKRIAEIQGLLASDNASMQEKGMGELIPEARQELIAELKKLSSDNKTIAESKAIEEELNRGVKINIETPTLELATPPSPFNKDLVKLGYEESDIAKMTMEQKQEIVTNKTEAPKVESSAKVDSVKENARQEKIAEAQAKLDEEEKAVIEEIKANEIVNEKEPNTADNGLSNDVVETNVKNGQRVTVGNNTGELHSDEGIPYLILDDGSEVEVSNEALKTAKLAEDNRNYRIDKNGFFEVEGETHLNPKVTFNDEGYVTINSDGGKVVKGQLAENIAYELALQKMDNITDEEAEILLVEITTNEDIQKLITENEKRNEQIKSERAAKEATEEGTDNANEQGETEEQLIEKVKRIDDDVQAANELILETNELASLEEKLKKAKTTSSRKEIQAKIDAEAKKVVVEKSINDVRDFLKDKFKINLPEGTQTKGFTLNQLIDLVADAAIELAKTGIDIELAIKQTIAALKEAKYIGDVDEAKLEASVKEKLPKKEEKAKQEAEQGKRKLTKDFLAENPQYEDKVSEGAINYQVLPNQISLDMANAIIDKEGLDSAIDKFSNFDYPMNDTVRVVLGQVLLARLQDNGQYDSVIKVLEQLTRTATNVAQQLQAFNVRSAISAETEYRIAQRIINKQRDLKAKTDKPKTDKIIKKAKEINKEVADQVVANLDDKINDNSKLKSKPNTNKADWGSKNKVFTKEAREKNKEALKKMFLSSVIPPQLIFEAGYHIEAGAVAFSDFYKSMTSEWGDKVIPYLKGAYKKASEDLIANGYEKENFSKDAEIENVVWENDKENKRLIKQVEVALKTKNRKAINKAIAELTNYAEKKGLWGQYRDYAIARLKAATAQSLSEDIKENVPLEDFTNGLVRNIQDQINEQIPEEERKKKESKPKKPAIEIIADAFKNIEKYLLVFNKTRVEFTKKYSLEGLTEKQKEAKLEALEMTQEQAENYLEQLDAYFGDLTPKPFSGKLIAQAVKEKLKDLNLSIADIVKQHYTVYDNAKKTLTEKLVQEAGLNEAEAAQLAKAIQNEFDRIAIEKKKQLLDKILSKKERKKSNVISLEEDIIRLTNLGAFSDQEILTAYAEKMGYPTLNQDNIKEIKRLADAVQLAKEGFDKSRAIENLLKYQANIKGVSKVDIAVSVWYANMLSGFSTQEVNFVANLLNSFLLYGNVVTQNPKFSKFVAQGYYEGFKRGWLEAKETLKTGYSPIRGKIEVPSLLERVDFKQLNVKGVDLNPANYLKYVGRVMKAADVVVFEALKDMRAYQLAAYEAGREGMLAPNQRQMDKAAEIVGSSDFQFQAATEEAQLIYEQELEDISNNTELTKEQKETASNQAKTDRTRRVYELMERNRPADIVAESSEFAARGTYNYKPEGFLGLMSSSMNAFKGSLSTAAEEADNKVVKYTAETLKVLTSIVIPFTNIIANVANEALNYTPVGILRAKAGKSAIGFNGKTLNDQEKIDMYTKSLIGLTAMTTLFLLSQSWGDDDEPILEITANGHGDFRQNYSLQETGWQPYSIRIGKGPWLSYQYTPLFIVLGFIGQIRDYEKYRNEKLSDDGIKTKVAVAAGHTMTSILDMTFLSSAETLLSSAMDPRSEDKFGQLRKMLKNSAQAIVVPALYVQTAKEMERQFDIPLKEVTNTYMGAILQHIPFARNMYYDKVNGLGEVIPPDTDKFISFSKDEKIWNLLKDKNISIILPSQKQIKVVDENDKQRFLTNEEYYNFVKKRGEVLKGLIEKNYDKIVKKDKKNAQEYVSDLKTMATTKAKLAVNKNIKEE